MYPDRVPAHPRRAGWLLLPMVIAVAVAIAWWWPRQPQTSPQGSITATPLRAPTTGDGPRFRRLRAFESGLDFTNELRKENSYQYLTNGAGLAVGDYDGDGLPDVYLVSQDGPNKLFRQDRPLHFVDVTVAAGNVDGGEAWGTGAVFVDIDGDGDLDLYVCNLAAPNLLYVNQGDGTFREEGKRFGLDITAASMMAAFADYDRDGRIDCYLLTNRVLHEGWTATPEVLDNIRPPRDTKSTPRQLVPTVEDRRAIDRLLKSGTLDDATIPEHLREHYLAFRGQAFMTGQQDRLLRNRGDRFVDVSQGAGIDGYGMGLSATFFDYDNDGWPDLYVANDLESPDRLWHNERNGTFRLVTSDVLPHTAYYGMGSDAGDVDGDGHIDLFVADMSATTHRMAKVLMGDMTRQRDFLIHARPPQYMRNALLLNTGAGRFQEAGFQAGAASTDWTWSTLFGDLDNDGRLDLFVTNGIARFDMDPDVDLRVKALWRQDRQQEAIAVIQNVRKVPERNLALRNAADLKFERTGADWALDLEAISHGAVLVDLDRDGDLDVITNNWNEPAGLWENRTADGHAIAVELRSSATNRFGIGARVEVWLPGGERLVRELFPARGYLSGQEPRLHFGVGRAPRIGALHVHWPSGHHQQFADLAVDQCYTIHEPAGRASRAAPAAPTAPRLLEPLLVAPQFTHREAPFDDFAAQPLLPSQLSRLGPGVAFGDADGDGQDDLFVGGATGQAGALFVREANGWRRVPGPWDADAAAEDMGVLWFDADGDGDQDLLVVSGGVEHPLGDVNYRDRFYRNDGGLRFVRDDAVLPDRRESGSSVAAADFDRDGDLDLVIGGRLVPGRYPDAPPTRLLRNDGGRFTDVTAELAPALQTAGMVTSVLWTDADGDGNLDLLVAAHWQPIRLLRNDGGRFVDATASAGLEPHRGWWNSLCAVDVDLDGDLDYIAGNQGLNTKYKASPEHPAGLLYDDFDDNGQRDLIETKFEGDRLLPVRGRSCSSQAMPFVAEKFPTYERFASALLQDIYPTDKLATCGKLEATVLAHCLLRNDGKGRFTVEPLPARAQLAPLFGIAVVGDLVVAGTNSFAPEPETGRHDGGVGLVLDRSLTPIAPRDAGLIAFGDHKGVASSGDVVVLASSDGPLSCWQRRPGAGPLRPLRLDLPRLPGNPTAVGTRLVVETAGSERLALEVHAGSGYLSQSSAQVVLPELPSPAVRVRLRYPDGNTETRELSAAR